MTINNKTTMSKEHIKAVMRASNFDNDRYKAFKLMYNLFGLLFGMMFVRYMIFELLGSSRQNNVMLVLYALAAVVFLYIGMYGMDRSNYKKYNQIYGKMTGITFSYEIDSDGIKVTDEENDSDYFEWRQVIDWKEDLDRFFLYVGAEECLILDKKGFDEETGRDFKELLMAVMQLRQEEQSVEQETDNS
jgi:hypothetical protein